MNSSGKTERLGVALIENIPPEVTDLQVIDYFISMRDVESVQVLKGGFPGKENRNCWINMRNPLKALQHIGEVAISGNRLQVSLMGYLYQNYTSPVIEEPSRGKL